MDKEDTVLMRLGFIKSQLEKMSDQEKARLFKTLAMTLRQMGVSEQELIDALR